MAPRRRRGLRAWRSHRRAFSGERSGGSVGILLSSNFASLHTGYYVVVTGIYASREDAEAALPAASRRFPNAAVRSVVR